jgi:hypothetical protein
MDDVAERYSYSSLDEMNERDDHNIKAAKL